MSIMNAKQVRFTRDQVKEIMKDMITGSKNKNMLTKKDVIASLFYRLEVIKRKDRYAYQLAKQTLAEKLSVKSSVVSYYIRLVRKEKEQKRNKKSNKVATTKDRIKRNEIEKK